MTDNVQLFTVDFLTADYTLVTCARHNQYVYNCRDCVWLNTTRKKTLSKDALKRSSNSAFSKYAKYVF